LQLRKLSKLKSLYLAANRLSALRCLREEVVQHLPNLQNLALGANAFNLAEAFKLPGCRIGLGWNAGTAPEGLSERLTEDFATTEACFDPASRGTRGEVLLVAFAGQGIGNLQWAAPCAAARAAGLAVDALYLADPANAYYLADPTGCWDGIAHYERLIARHASRYARVLMVGSSMGGTAALTHSALAHRVLAFGPRVDLTHTHGSYVDTGARRACMDRIHATLGRDMGLKVTVHVGSGNLEDVLQAGRVEGHGVTVTAHDTFHHNVPMYLQREGRLVPLIKRTLVALLLEGDGN